MGLFGKGWKRGVYPGNLSRRMNLFKYAITVLLVLGGVSPVLYAGESLASFLGKAAFEKQRLFNDQRYPNVVVTTRGTVMAVWGNDGVVVRRSEDGGNTWGNAITVAKKGYSGGGTTVDANSGDVLVFVEDRQPPAPLTVYRSRDDGKTWQAQSTVIAKDELGNMPSMHMNEHGITLRRGPHKGRLLRPTRYYGSNGGEAEWSQQYTNAVYSDDGGRSWKTSKPFPEKGTGEATLVELSDGRIYYNSRVHWDQNEHNTRRRSALSRDGGVHWEDWRIVHALPDGHQHRSYGCMGGLVRLPIEGRDLLVFSNLDTPKATRERVTLWLSADGGQSWPIKRLVYDGPSGYSSLNAGRPGTASEGWMYLFFEGGPGGGGQMVRVNLTWLLQGVSNEDGQLPDWLTSRL